MARLLIADDNDAMRDGMTLSLASLGHEVSAVKGGAEAMMFGPHTTKLLQAAVATGVDARSSRDAGSYLCNYLSWRAIETTCEKKGPALAAFVHVSPLASGVVRQRRGTPNRVTLEELDRQLRKEYGDTYKGAVFYNSAREGWRPRLRKLMAEINMRDGK